MSWLDRSRNAIAQGCLTNSKKPESYLVGAYPTHIKAANGCYLYDDKDTKYTDFVCGLGSNLFGYGNEIITQAVMKHIYSGANHSLPTIHEVIAAETFKEIFPYCERIKFVKNGGDACQAAVRFARAYTNDYDIYTTGYHGCSDEFTGLSQPAKGIGAHYNIYKLEDGELPLGNHAAAVIIEPIMLDHSRTRIEYLKKLRKWCTDNGALLIFDEVITGLRFKDYSVTNHYGVKPDLVCFGKAVGGGYSVAAVGGRADILDDPEVFISYTYAGETLPLIAANTALKMVQAKADYNIDYLWEKGGEFLSSFNNLGGPIKLEGYPTRAAFKGTLEHRALFCQIMIEAKVLFHPSTWFFNFPLINCAEDVLQLCEIAFEKMATSSLKYPLPASPFAAKVRGD